MDVAPWNVHWIKMVLDGIEWYWTVLNSIWWYWMGWSQISKEILCMKFKWLQVGQHQTPQYRLSWRKVSKRNMFQPHKIGQPWDAHQVTGLTWKGEEGTQGKNMGCCGKFRITEKSLFLINQYTFWNFSIVTTINCNFARNITSGLFRHQNSC